MKINGIALGSALFLTIILANNLDAYMKESYIVTLIVAGMGLGCWYFAIDNSQKQDKKQ
jgi:general stress protein CsbA